MPCNSAKFAAELQAGLDDMFGREYLRYKARARYATGWTCPDEGTDNVALPRKFDHYDTGTAFFEKHLGRAILGWQEDVYAECFRVWFDDGGTRAHISVTYEEMEEFDGKHWKTASPLHSDPAAPADPDPGDRAANSIATDPNTGLAYGAAYDPNAGAYISIPLLPGSGLGSGLGGAMGGFNMGGGPPLQMHTSPQQMAAQQQALTQQQAMQYLAQRGLLQQPYSPPPAKPVEHAGLRMGEIIAWRAWDVEPRSMMLKSPVQDDIWAPGEVMKGEVDPTGESWAGVNAYKEAKHALAEFNHSSYVIGRVALYGECVEYEDGYRAEMAIPVELCFCTQDHLNANYLPRLKAKYDRPEYGLIDWPRGAVPADDYGSLPATSGHGLTPAVAPTVAAADMPDLEALTMAPGGFTVVQEATDGRESYILTPRPPTTLWHALNEFCEDIASAIARPLYAAWAWLHR